jgi:ketosteroid isomerase-like protein
VTSDADVAAVCRAIDAFNEGGVQLDSISEPPKRVFVDEPEIVPFRAALEDTVYSGPSAIEDFWDDSRESWSELHFALERIETSGSGVLAVGTLTATSRETGARVETKLAFAAHVRDGLVSRLASHLSEQSARRELGAE